MTTFFKPSWSRFFNQSIKNLFLIFTIIVILGLFRAFLYLQFRVFFNELSLPEIAIMAYLGTKLDLMVAGYIAAIPAFMGILCGFVRLDRLTDKTRVGLFFLFILLCLLIMPINYFFITEYKENFNQLIFEIFYDDLGAILKSTWTLFPVMKVMFTALCMVFLFIFLGLKLLKLQPEQVANFPKNKLMRFLVTVFIFTLFIGIVRGSYGDRPVQRRDISVSTNRFLNKITINPYMALVWSVKDHRKLNNSDHYPDDFIGGSIQNTCRLFFNTDKISNNIDDYLIRKSNYPRQIPARHIFFIVLESADSWSLMPKYQSFDLMPQLKFLGENGYINKKFLPSSNGTMSSLAGILTGIPDVGVHTNYQSSSLRPYPTSLAPQFNKLGYQTNFFYGGFLGWQQIGDFAKNQGFDNVYGGNHIGNWKNSNEWGVDDRALYDFVLQTIDNDQPSFNFILTTTNHSPFDVPIYDEGFPYRKIPDEIEQLYSGEIPVTEFGHYWYADKVMGEFVARTQELLPLNLFAITGDHRSRRYLGVTKSIYENISVPFVLYGPGIDRESVDIPPGIAANHLDIMPTLFDLITPVGFSYYSFGYSLFAKDRPEVTTTIHAAMSDEIITMARDGEIAPERIGVLGRMGEKLKIQMNEIANADIQARKEMLNDMIEDPTYWAGDIQYEIIPFLSIKQEEIKSDPQGMQDKISAMRAIGWWRILKGSSMTQNQQP